MSAPNRHTTRILALAASVAIAAPAMAADVVVPIEPIQFEEMYEGKPAVSGLNGKIEIGYNYYQYDLFDPAFDGDVNAQSIYGMGSVSAPLGQQFGIQLDLGLSQSFEDDILFGLGQVDHSAYGIGAHLFWRDPDTALVGVYGHYLRLNRDTDILFLPFKRQTDVFRVAAAGEYYIDDFSLEGHIGADFLRTRLSIFGGEISNESGTFLNARAVAAYYPIDNARIFAGAKYAFEEFAGVAGAEYMFASDSPVAPAVFVEGSYGQETKSISAGLRVYFGPTGKSLKARHREDDPRAQLFDDLAIIGACSATTGDVGPLEAAFDGPFEGPDLDIDEGSLSFGSSCGLSAFDGDGPDLPGDDGPPQGEFPDLVESVVQ